MDDRVAIVTGGGSGIGESTALVLAQRGLDVALVGRRSERLEKVASAIRGAGGRALAVPADLARPEAPREVVEYVVGERGRVDVIVNNAASLRVTPIEDYTLEDFDDDLAVNVRAPYFLVQAALPTLRSSAAAVVVNVSSAAAVMYRRRQTVYGLSKAALEHMTLNMAAELAPERIRVVCVRPGPVATEIHTAVDDPDTHLRELEAQVPLGRIGRPEDIARWIAHLVDRGSEWVTGAVFTIDGGRLLGPPGA